MFSSEYNATCHNKVIRELFRCSILFYIISYRRELEREIAVMTYVHHSNFSNHLRIQSCSIYWALQSRL